VGSPLKTGESPTYGYQAPLSRAVRQQTGATTMTVGLIVHADHAESLVSEGSADLVAIGREALLNPNWALDCALKLGLDDPWSLTATTSAFCLRQRERAMPDLVPSSMVGPTTTL
jgi:2,4-dienoyl-CoA reductase-like NADH-dependent reductase (Old Yellow Enzyme family)